MNTILDILLKPSLDRHDIEKLEGVKREQARKIMLICKKPPFNGTCVYRNDHITTRSYFAYNGENYDRWLASITTPTETPQ